MNKSISLIFFILSLYSCQNRDENFESFFGDNNLKDLEVALTQDEILDFGLQFIEPSEIESKKTLKLSGRTTLHFDDNYSVLSNTTGYVGSIFVRQGESVNKGEVLAIINVEKLVDLQEDYLILNNTFRNINDEYLNLNNSSDDSSIIKIKKDRLKSELDLLNIKKRFVEEKLRINNINPKNVSVNNIKRTISITAPISGVVKTNSLTAGQFVNEYQLLFEISKTPELTLKIKAFPDDLNYIKVNQVVTATTSNDSENPVTIKAKIVSISNIKNEDGSTDVLAKIENSKKLIASQNIYFDTNIHFVVSIDYQTDKSKFLPEESIIDINGKNFVFQSYNSNSLKLVAVETGHKISNMIEINSNIDYTKKYVCQGAKSLFSDISKKQFLK